MDLFLLIVPAALLCGVVGYFLGQANPAKPEDQSEKIPVDILKAHGLIERGHAVEVPHLGGWQIWCKDGIWSAFGLEDGSFPGGTFFGWERFAFVKREGVATVHYDVE